MNKLVVLCIVLLLVLSVTELSYAGDWTLHVNLGSSAPIGDGSEYWNTGFAVGFEAYRPISGNLLLGGRFAFNGWGLNGDKVLEGEDPTLSWETSGATAISEFVPSIRYLFKKSETSNIRFFGHIGIGFYGLASDWKLKAIDAFGNWVEVTYEDTGTYFGTTIGGGIVFGNPDKVHFEFVPMYNTVFTEDESTNYFSGNLGLIFNL